MLHAWEPVVHYDKHCASCSREDMGGVHVGCLLVLCTAVIACPCRGEVSGTETDALQEYSQ